MMSHHLSGGEGTENYQKQIFGAAELILKVSRAGSRRLLEEVLNFLSSTELR